MKKKQVNEILVNQTKRRNKIISYICFIAVITFLFIAFLTLFIQKSKTQYINYKEQTDLDYKVYLKENEFYKDNYLESDNQYIASLIDYINAQFNYKLSIDEKNIDYSYSYRIEANVKVTETDTKKDIYNYNEDIVTKDLVNANSNSDVTINENVKIDYNEYNDLIKRFVSVYDLDKYESTLLINMYVTVDGNCDDENTSSVMTLSIPLTTKTVGIDIKTDLQTDNEDNIMVCKSADEFATIFLIISLIIFVIDCYIIYRLSLYIIKTRTAESIYERELKKILNNYKSYIQKINNSFDLKGYQVLKVDTFTDMLEIRDTIGEPILMVENSKKNGTFFLIPSKTKVLYLYALKVNDIKKRLGSDIDEEN